METVVSMPRYTQNKRETETEPHTPSTHRQAEPNISKDDISSIPYVLDVCCCCCFKTLFPSYIFGIFFPADVVDTNRQDRETTREKDNPKSMSKKAPHRAAAAAAATYTTVSC